MAELEFEFDNGNIEKLQRVLEIKKVFISEAVSVFADRKKKILETYNDANSSEKRYICFGKSNRGRYIRVIFVIRGNKIRIFNALPFSQKKHYEFYNSEI